MDQTNKVMTPTEFVLWLNGATSMVDGPPSAEQWAKMQEKLFPIIAKMMTDKLLDKADDAVKLHELQQKVYQEQVARNQLLIQQMRNQQQLTYTTNTPWPTAQDPLGQNVHRTGQIQLHTGAVSISPNAFTVCSGNFPG